MGYFIQDSTLICNFDTFEKLDSQCSYYTIYQNEFLQAKHDVCDIWLKARRHFPSFWPHCSF